jgi:putative tricarboxylic transport membrane protein
VKKYQLYIILVWIAIGIFVSSYAFKLGLGKLSGPGPGFMPFWLGVIIACLALYKLTKEFLLKKKESNTDTQTVNAAVKSSFIGKLVFIIMTLLAYALLLDQAGYIIITFLVMVLLLRFSGYTQWSRIIAYSIIIVGISYFMFQYLGVRFPVGVLGYFGLF